MVFVTAANSRYFPALGNLVGSIHYWAPGRDIIVYDLGLEDAQIREIDRWRHVAVVQRYIPADVPPHVRAVHTYAWKPIAMNHALGDHEAILWIDAGSDLRSPPETLRRFLKADGHFFVRGQDRDMTQTSHDLCYQAMGARKVDFMGLQHFAGNLQGYVANGGAHHLVLRPMLELALREECIAPPGSDLSNHRYDQTLLSILLYRCGLDVAPHTEMLCARRDELAGDPTEASLSVVFTARGRSADYANRIEFRDGSRDQSSDPGGASAPVKRA